jgi:diaminopimelate decarboxylase
VTDLLAAAAIAGRTPFYLYDFAAVRERVGRVRAALPGGVRLHYAIKANPMPALVQRLAPLVDGLDVASHGELLTALATGADRDQISLAGPGKRDHELGAAIAAGVVVNVESGDELARLRRIEATAGRPARFALRINPDFQLTGSGMTMGGGATQFGIDAEAVGEVLGGRGRRGLCGLHIFAGSQNLRLPALQSGVSQAFELADRLIREYRLELAHVNIGGGLGIPYFPGEQPLDLPEYGRHLAVEVERWRNRYRDTQVVLELGRYLVGEAGVFVSRVVERKRSRGETFLVVDGGLHHHLAASGNFGQVVRRNYPLSAVTAKPGAEPETVTVVGPLCTPLDTLGRRVELPRCEVGDLVVVHQSGAYGPTASPVHFLGHPPPVELLL